MISAKLFYENSGWMTRAGSIAMAKIVIIIETGCTK
jgi:hypothetical protein